MGRRQQARTQPTHSVEVRQTYDRVLAGASVRRRYVEVGASGRVHLLEKGAGPPVVLLHGTGTSAGFFMPLLHELGGVRALAPDLPGVGLSDPIDLPRNRYRNTAVAWLDRLLDALGLDTTTLLGHSGGGVWALWYALAHPDRVEQLVLDLVDLLVAVGRDPIADRAVRAEFRVLVSPFALLSPSGFRRRSRVRPDELQQVAMPTLVLWGEQEPLGSVPVAETVTELIPHARLEVLPTGHGPWLGQPVQTAATVVDFVRDQINAPRPS